MRSTYLFVYGTLLQPGNEFAVYLAQHSYFTSPGKIKGKLYDIGEYPGLIVDDTAGYVWGSTYKIESEDVLTELDMYEGIGTDEEQPHLYRRRLLPVETDNGLVTAWVYAYNRTVDKLHLIECGDYLQYLRQKKSPDS